MSVVFTAAVILGAALVFFVQPMVARMLLPSFGGSPSVWIASMLFFQSALLAGYALAHALARRRPGGPALAAYLVGIASLVLLLPPSLAAAEGVVGGLADAHRVLVLLALTVGLPFTALATTGPLLQRWFSRLDHARSSDPYFLYAAGNAGSLGAMLAYPLVLEPWLTLGAQAWLFAAGYVAWAGLVAVCGVSAARSSALRLEIPAARDAAGPTAARRLRWLVLAFAPSSVLLGVTQYLTTDLAPVPLLWVVPLSIYLVTFVASFARGARIAPARWGIALAIAAPLLAATLRANLPLPLPALVLFHLAVVLFAALACHARLAADRPAPAHLTGFYLTVAAGGALGGAFNALVAPALFDSIAEYPLAVILACALRPSSGRRPAPVAPRAWLLDLAWPAGLGAAILAAEWARVPASPWARLALGGAATLCFVPWPRRQALAVAAFLLPAWLGTMDTIRVVEAERTFFGVNRVLEIDQPPLAVHDAAGNERWLARQPYRLLEHGTTGHGSQYPDPELGRVPTAYYHRSGPLGQVFAAFDGGDRLDRVAVVGLGAGTLAAYARSGRRITFLEIDLAVERIAREHFTYLRDAPGPVDVVIGDGRARAAELADGSLGLLVLDAFSSDAVPVHLLTREAVSLYLTKLAADGLLAAHVTSEYVDLVPVLAAVRRDLGIDGRWQDDRTADLQQFLELKAPSTWVVLARDRAALGTLADDPRWRELPADPPRAALWTDEFSNLVGVIKWRRSAAP